MGGGEESDRDERTEESYWVGEGGSRMKDS
jgi:hypothetical protein